MTLYDFYKIKSDGLNDDISDNYIDIAISISIDSDFEKSGEYKNLIDFTVLLMKKSEIECINGDVIVCKFSDIINNNIDSFKKFIRDNWVDSMQYVLSDDSIEHGDFHYEILKEFDNVVIGNYGEKINKKYLELLKACK